MLKLLFYFKFNIFFICLHFKDEKRIIDHDPHLLRVACVCPDCLKHREAVIMVFLEDIEYNNLWERLQLLVRNYYDLISK